MSDEIEISGKMSLQTSALQVVCLIGMMIAGFNMPKTTESYKKVPPTICYRNESIYDNDFLVTDSCETNKDMVLKQSSGKYLDAFNKNAAILAWKIEMTSDLSSGMQQNLVGILQMDFKSKCVHIINGTMFYDFAAKLGYQNHEEDTWRLYDSVEDKKNVLNCSAVNSCKGGIQRFTCTKFLIFELGMIRHSNYVLNLYLQNFSFAWFQNDKDADSLEWSFQMHLVHTNDFLNKVKLMMKNVMLPIALAVFVRFWHDDNMYLIQTSWFKLALLTSMTIIAFCNNRHLDQQIIDSLGLFKNLRETFFQVLLFVRLVGFKFDLEKSKTDVLFKSINYAFQSFLTVFLYDFLERQVQYLDPLLKAWILTKHFMPHIFVFTIKLIGAVSAFYVVRKLCKWVQNKYFPPSPAQRENARFKNNLDCYIIPLVMCLVLVFIYFLFLRSVSLYNSDEDTKMILSSKLNGCFLYAMYYTIAMALVVVSIPHLTQNSNDENEANE